MKVINFFAGQGAGKSSLATGVFSYLKFKGINAEYVSEYAKDVTWEESFKKLDNQFYIAAKQHHRLFKMKDKVDLVITDSPIVLGCFYGASKSLAGLLLEEFTGYDNINIFVKRTKEYNPAGRSQTEDEAKELDSKIQDFLISHKIDYTEFEGTWENITVIGEFILSHILKKDTNNGWKPLTDTPPNKFVYVIDKDGNIGIAQRNGRWSIEVINLVNEIGTIIGWKPIIEEDKLPDIAR